MFVSPQTVKLLQQMVQLNPNIIMYAVNHDKTKQIVTDDAGVMALTWGVFPNREIAQPTIFDPVTFVNVWSDEAFGLWTSMWLNLYQEGSDSYDLIRGIRENYYLVAIIDNDFMNKDYFWKKLHDVGKQGCTR